jgi:hypothetical protein
MQSVEMVSISVASSPAVATAYPVAAQPMQQQRLGDEAVVIQLGPPSIHPPGRAPMVHPGVVRVRACHAPDTCTLATLIPPPLVPTLIAFHILGCAVGPRWFVWGVWQGVVVEEDIRRRGTSIDHL